MIWNRICLICSSTVSTSPRASVVPGDRSPLRKRAPSASATTSTATCVLDEMRKQLAPTNRWTWCSVALCLAAAGCLVWQMWRGDENAPLSAPASASDQKAAEGERQLASFQLAPAEDFEEILARPLFNRSRRPDLAQENAQGGSEEAPAAQISLNGIVLAGGK